MSCFFVTPIERICGAYLGQQKSLPNESFLVEERGIKNDRDDKISAEGK